MTKRKAYTVRMTPEQFEKYKIITERREGHQLEQQEFIERAIRIYGSKNSLFENLTTKGKLKRALRDIEELKSDNERLQDACITPDATLMQMQNALHQADAKLERLKRNNDRITHQKGRLESKLRKNRKSVHLYERQLEWCLDQIKCFDGKTIREIAYNFGIESMDSKIVFNLHMMPKD